MKHTISNEDFTKSVRERFQKSTDQELVNKFNRECGGNGWTNTRSIFLDELRKEMRSRKWDKSAITNETGGFNLADGNQVYLEGHKLHLIKTKTQL